jgi:hypothetical protein
MSDEFIEVNCWLSGVYKEFTNIELDGRFMGLIFETVCGHLSEVRIFVYEQP